MSECETFNRRQAIGVMAAGASAAMVGSPAFAQATNIRMVVTAAFVSDKGMAVYEDIAKYLSQKTGWNVSTVSGISYSEADAALDKGQIQIGYVCGLPYVHKNAEGKYDLLALPIMGLKKGTYADAQGYESVPGKYFSYTIVHKDSPLKTWADLKGKTYAFNDMGSNSGYNLPRAKLVSLGAKDWGYFSKVVVSGSHEESIRLVAKKAVDASSVDSLVLDYDRSIKDAAAMNVRIIEHLGPAGVPPVVISRKADPGIKGSLQAALLGMHKDPAGAAILAKGLMLRFDQPNDKNYDDVRKFEQMAKAAGFVDHKA